MKAPFLVGCVFAVALWISLKVLVEEPDDAKTKKTKANKKTKGVNSDGDGTSLMKDVMFSATMWRLGMAYFFISIIRTGLVSWTPLLLKDVPGSPAVTCMFLLETGATLSGLMSGFISDKVFGGQRGPMMVICSSALAVVHVGLHSAAGLPVQALYVLYFLIGMFAFCPHMLYGLAAREAVPAKYMSSAGGIVKGIGQLGGAFAGYPLARISEVGGWDAVHVVFIASGVLSAAFIAIKSIDIRPKQE